MDSIADLKKRLTDLGLSTNTPGLTGDDRKEELQYRLDVALAQRGDQKNSSVQAVSQTSSIPGVGQLSIAEIRSRLMSLGENTSTPGLSGDDRKNELMQRLVRAICMNDSEKSDDILDEIIQKSQEAPITVRIIIY